MTGDAAGLAGAPAGRVAAVAPSAPVAPVALIPLGDANAVVCEGDVCYVPGAAD
ncbi:hypothetical protein [Leifsonia sp. NPDC058248]|uniref:hypothetical protein n=1 Tax=Leifsonia sp. NPDC058248 TaxID=3346402 RepID=UPI0036DDB885